MSAGGAQVIEAPLAFGGRAGAVITAGTVPAERREIVDIRKRTCTGCGYARLARNRIRVLSELTHIEIDTWWFGRCLSAVSRIIRFTCFTVDHSALSAVAADTVLIAAVAATYTPDWNSRVR